MIPLSSDTITFTIKVAGNIIADSFSVLAVNVAKQVNKISSAGITILDGDAASGTFEVSSSKVFELGNSITIEAGYDGKNTLIFSGVISGQSIRINMTSMPTIVVECRDVKGEVSYSASVLAKKVNHPSPSVLMVRYGDNLLELNADLNAHSCLPKVKSKISGCLKVQGVAVETGAFITLQGVGDKFSGNHFVSGINHDIGEGNWTSEIYFGLSSYD